MSQLHETEYGKRFFGYQLPALIKAIEKLADSQKNQEAIPMYPFPLAAEETRERLIAVMNDSTKAEAFARAFCDQFKSDGDSYESIGFHMARALLNNNIEEFLVAVVGWTSRSLLNIAETGSAELQGVNSNE